MWMSGCARAQPNECVCAHLYGCARVQKFVNINFHGMRKSSRAIKLSKFAFSGILRVLPSLLFEGGYQPSTHSNLGFPFDFSLFVASSLKL